MKLKLNDEGVAVLDNGRPIYVHDDGKEIPFDGLQAFNKIKELNNENKSWREKYEETRRSLEPFADLDAEAARQAMETVKNLDDKKLIDAGEVETVKRNLAASFDANLGATKKSYETKIEELNAKLTRQNQNIDELLVLGAFERSPFIQTKTNLTADIAYASFGHALKVEYNKEGKPEVIGYLDNEKLFSRRDPGKFADPEESIEMVINAYKQKDKILKGSGYGGSGAGPGSGMFDPDDFETQLQAAQKAGNVAAMISLKRKISERRAGT